MFRIRIRRVRIWIQHFRLNTNPDPGPVFWWPKIDIYCWDKNWYFFYQKLQFTSPPQRTSKLQEKPSALKTEHPAFQNITFLLVLWVIYALLDSDPDSESGSGSTDLIESGFNSDPDLKHWLHLYQVVKTGNDVWIKSPFFTRLSLHVRIFFKQNTF